MNLLGFSQVEPAGELSLNIGDKSQTQAQGLEQAKALKTVDLAQREQMIAMYLAQGQGDEIQSALSAQMEEEPENLNLSLSLSKVYTEQGNDTAALNVL